MRLSLRSPTGTTIAYRYSVLRSYHDVRRIARYLAELPHITGRVVADFITAACNAVGLELPRR